MDKPLKKLGLDTAQFGSHYGISNIDGPPAKKEIEKIIDLAYRNRVRILDTAPANGEAEKIIGDALNKNSNIKFNIVTKNPMFDTDAIKKRDFNP